MEKKSFKNYPIKRCSKCRIKCTSATSLQGTNSSITLVEGPREIQHVSKNENEFKLRIWSYMEPPRISDPMPAVNPVRVEKVRGMLNGTMDDSLETHVDSKMNIQILADGTIRKIKSRMEYKVYPPVLRMNTVHKPKKNCKPDCTVVEHYDSEDETVNDSDPCAFFN